MKRLKGSVKTLYQTWYQDGIGDLAQGLVFMFVALYFYLIPFIITDFPWNVIFQLVFLVIIFSSSFLVRFIVKKLKERITIPRIGYVQFRKDRKMTRQSRIYRIILGLGVGVMVTLIISFLPVGNITWSFFFLGIGVGLIFFYAGWLVNVFRYYLHTAISVITGTYLAFYHTGEFDGLMIFFGVLALSQFVSGIIVLSLFLKQHPVEDVEV
ncbi:MAG: hypothetical protein JEZ06_20130 [Anaerolineaceae bacterium]|nr:hypothetical protein [Anaerolineaceae bacterium]